MDNNTNTTERIEAAMVVLQRWQCSPEDIQSFIGDERKFVNISLILDIDQALVQTFSNEENINGFIKMPNRNGKFNGQTPLEYMLREGIDGMQYALEIIRGMTNR